jgi:hypothetical protein
MFLKRMFGLLISIVFLISLGSRALAAEEKVKQPAGAARESMASSEATPEQPKETQSKEKEEVLEEQESKTEERKPHLPEIKEELKEKKTFEVHGGLVGFYQGAAAGKIEGEKVDPDNTLGFGIAADLQATYRPPVPFLEGGRLFVRVHAGKGFGADENVGTKLFANLNTIADNSDDLQKDFDKVFWLAEAYYAHEFADGKITFVIGKTEPVVFIDNNAFANNANSQFIGKPFVNNPVLNSEDQLAPIVAATFTPIESISITALAVSSSHPNSPFEWDQKGIYSRIFDQPLVAAQLAYAPKFGELQGNYRVYYWNATYHHENSAGDTSPDGWGVGLSFDQQLTECFGLFARLAYSSRDAYDTDWFWSFGTNMKGIIPCRDKDELGIGIGGLKGTVAPFNDGTEFHTELYYRIYLNEYFAVSPDIQYVVNPLGNDHNDGLFAGMLRVEFSF